MSSRREGFSRDESADNDHNGFGYDMGYGRLLSSSLMAGLNIWCQSLAKGGLRCTDVFIFNRTIYGVDRFLRLNRFSRTSQFLENREPRTQNEKILDPTSSDHVNDESSLVTFVSFALRNT